MKRQQSCSTPSTASASFPFSPDFLPLAMAFTEKAVRGFAFGEKETSSLVLAVEEIFSFYLDQLSGATGIDLRLANENYQLVVTIGFRVAHPDLRAFNLTYRVNPEDEDSLAGLGPMIAARSVTRLRLDFGHDERLDLQLTRTREYAAVQPLALPALPPAAALRFQLPGGADIDYFARLATADDATWVPPWLLRSGMAADMLAAGALGGILASRGETMVGGVFWRNLSESTIELFGPYLLYPDPDDTVLSDLLDEAVGRIARSGARSLLRRQGRLAGYDRFFDRLGELVLIRGGETVRWTHYYKQLREESGATVYAEPRFAAFLCAEYDRLCLPRQVREALPPSDARGRSAASVFSVDFEPERSLATLRLLVKGNDLAGNLTRHMQLLEREGIRNIIVEIDTALPDDSALVPLLYAVGFTPRLLLPEAGRGDLVIFCSES